MKKLGLPLGTILLAVLFVVQPKPAHAVSAAAVQCAVVAYPCPGGSIIAAGALDNGIGALGANQFNIMNYGFAFAGAGVDFTGSVMATDVAGLWTYLWATGTATDLMGGAQILDVAFQQLNYLTAPGPATYNDLIFGDCAPGTGANSGAIAQGLVNATGLSVISANCSVFNPFVSFGTPVNGTAGLFTSLTAAVQFVFTAGSLGGSTITLPWGVDFPDPNVLGDTNSGGGFIDPSDTADITNLGLQAAPAPAPEPGTFALFGLALSGLGVMARRRRTN